MSPTLHVIVKILFLSPVVRSCVKSSSDSSTLKVDSVCCFCCCKTLKVCTSWCGGQLFSTADHLKTLPAPWKLASSFTGVEYFPQAFADNNPETHWRILCLPTVSIFPPSVLTMEAEASPAETMPLCLIKNSDAQAHAELPSSTTLGRPQSPAALPEEMSAVRKRSPQDSPTYIRSKMKVKVVFTHMIRILI